MPEERPNVVVAATDQRARARIAGALSAQPEFCVRVGGSARDLVAGKELADLLVFHCGAVGGGELNLLAAIKQQRPRLLIVVVCASANGRSARRAVDGGVDGLVFADALEAALAPTVAAVLAGQTAVPRELRASARKPSLSYREKQILGMVVMGFTNGEISSRLVLAESTVKSHLTSAFSKLGVRSRSEAAAMILDPKGSLGTGILAITGQFGTAQQSDAS